MGWTPHSFAMPRLAPTILSTHSIGALELCHGSDGDGTLLDAENGYGFAEPILSSLWRGYPNFGLTPTWPKSTDICLSQPAKYQTAISCIKVQNKVSFPVLPAGRRTRTLLRLRIAPCYCLQPTGRISFYVTAFIPQLP